MKERPIIFTGEMVRAIIEGRKTQTRRVVKPQPHGVGECFALRNNGEGYPCPYGVSGGRLWIRETWANADTVYGSELDPPAVIAYRADKSARNLGEPVPDYDLASWNWDRIKWRPSIHMPRWASRITLEVTDVRVERLQDITEADAKAEGLPLPPGPGVVNGEPATVAIFDPLYAFHNLWDSINALRTGCAWADNPWCWCVSFRRVQP